MKTGERCGNAGPWTPVENSPLALQGVQARHRVSHRRPPPLEIANGAISTFPQRRRICLPKTKKQHGSRPSVARPTHSRKEDSFLTAKPKAIPTFQAHPALESKAGFRLISRWNQTSISGSFLDWKMLGESCPIQNDLEGSGCFQHRMILNSFE
jgi:hypothetical protein